MGGSDADGGTSTRVLGTLLTWLQEKSAPVFVFATANDVTRLPPELVRRGRIDELFFVDLPNKTERQAIWKVHAEKRGKKLTEKEYKALADDSIDFSGAEIEAAFLDAMFSAFVEEREVAIADCQEAVRKTVPLAKTAKDKIDAIRSWAKGNARMASSKEETTSSDRASELEFGFEKGSN